MVVYLLDNASSADMPKPAIDTRAAIVPQIYGALRREIVTMQLRPGQALSEKEIADRFGVSRQPVREAFIKLAEKELVQVMPQRGTYVSKISVRDLANARFVREAVEVAVARSACAIATDASIARLREVIAAQREAEQANDQVEFLARDEDFHRLLAEAVDGAKIWLVVEDVKAQMDRVRYLTLPRATPAGLLIEQHTDIVNAVAARDPAAAETAMRVHLREILLALPRMFRDHPDLFDTESLPAHALDLDPGKLLSAESGGAP